ncbi:LysR family transcriptional regulator [Ramlibacter sp.]|uniref:LysR family transcriptional regulator n=1 Tax=Ramlibacter sp. TaxID=1917967 RepID=UPI003D11E0A3
MDYNLARFDLVSIRLAVLCAELGSLSAAAKEVHCSLSTGSYRLSTLEYSFGKPLFTRDRRGLHPTAAGEVFVRHARHILERVELMTRQVASLPDDLPEVTNFPEVRTNPYGFSRTAPLTSTG